LVEFFGAGVAGGEEGGEGAAAGGGAWVARGARNFANQAVCAEQAQQAADLTRLRAALRRRRGLWMQPAAEAAAAEPVQQELAAQQEFGPLGVGTGAGREAAEAASAGEAGGADGIGQLSRRRRGVGGREGGEGAGVGGLRERRATGQIDHAFARQPIRIRAPCANF
jgi:hypothetical protein